MEELVTRWQAHGYALYIHSHLIPTHIIWGEQWYLHLRGELYHLQLPLGYAGAWLFKDLSKLFFFMKRSKQHFWILCWQAPLGHHVRASQSFCRVRSAIICVHPFSYLSLFIYVFDILFELHGIHDLFINSGDLSSKWKVKINLRTEPNSI